MNLDTPKVSILMPVYNTGPYVKEAIESLLKQTFVDFELLIFNDGSSDNSSIVINGIKDARIRFFDSKDNKGYVAHLNNGIDLARGEFIARMDSDDVALPDRLAKQVEFMQNNPEIGVCGTAFQMFGDRDTIFKMPLDDFSIREYMLVHNPLGHPTVIMRKSVLKKYNLYYISEFMPAEDYRMWYDFSKVSLLANLPDILLNYRAHSQQISETKNAIQFDNINKTRWAQLHDKGFALSQKEVEIYCKLLEYKYYCTTQEDIYSARQVMESILKQNLELKAFPNEWFEKIFSSRWHIIFSSIKAFYPKHISIFLIDDYPMKRSISGLNKLRILVKAILFWKVSTTS